MSKINFPKKQEQRLIPKYLLEYAEELQENHPDPSAEWGGSGGSPIEAGTGIIITGDDTKTISVDTEDVAMVSNLATVAFSGSYNDLSNTPTIPTKTSDLDNDSGFITGIDSADVISALGYTPGTSNFDGDYNSLTNKPTIPDAVSGTNDGTNWTTLTIGNDTYGLASGGTTYTAGTGIDITNDTISVDTSVIAEVSDIPTDVSQLNNDSGYITGITSGDVTTALGYTPGTSNFSGSYTDLTDKPTIPTATSQLTNDSGFITSSDLPTNHVTTNTDQTITGAKTFQGSNLIKFKGYPASDTMGFTAYTITGGAELGNLQIKERAVSVKNGYAQNLTLTTLGNYSNASTSNSATGFRVSAHSGGSRTINFLAPYVSYTNLVDVYGTTYDTYFIPMAITDGTDTVFANYTGKVDISSLLPTKTSDLTNDSGFITGVTWNDVTNKPTFATVATTGDYDDLTNKPTIPTDTSDLTNGAGFITSSSLPDMTNYYTKTEINTNYYDRTDVDDIVDNVAADIPEIFANQPNPTTALTSLSINNTNYSIPAAQIQSDWNQSDNTAVDYIKNKPTIPTTATSTSTVTPTTIQLTFTYTDDTTETVTLMTAATVSTTTTLS